MMPANMLRLIRDNIRIEDAQQRDAEIKGGASTAAWFEKARISASLDMRRDVQQEAAAVEASAKHLLAVRQAALRSS